MTHIAAIILLLGLCLPQALLAGEVLQAGEIDSSKVEIGVYKENKPRRIVGKLAGGVLGGTLIGLAVGSAAEKAAGDCTGTFCGVGNFVIVGWIGYLVGVPVGMSFFDPYDQFKYSLAGSLIGGAASLVIFTDVELAEEKLWPALFIGPLVGATIMSEFFRKPPENRRVSIGLLPGPKGRVSAVATLRF